MNLRMKENKTALKCRGCTVRLTNALAPRNHLEKIPSAKLRHGVTVKFMDIKYAMGLF